MILIKNLEKHLKEKYNADFLYINTNSKMDIDNNDWIFYTTTDIVFYKDGLKQMMRLKDVTDEKNLLKSIDELF